MRWSAEGLAGQITSVDEAARTATIDGLEGPALLMRHVVDVQPGDVAVVLLVAGQRWVAGLLGAGVVEAPDEGEGPVVLPPTPAPVPPERRVLRPAWSGTFRAGSWRGDTSDLYQGDYTGRGINIGACWWGALPTDLGAATVTLKRLPGAGAVAAVAPTMALLAGTARPSGAPTIMATTPGPSMPRTGAGSTREWDIPEAWIGRMASGEAAGIGITTGGARDPYMALSASGVGMTLVAETGTIIAEQEDAHDGGGDEEVHG